MFDSDGVEIEIEIILCGFGCMRWFFSFFVGFVKVGNCNFFYSIVLIFVDEEDFFEFKMLIIGFLL